MSQFTKYSAVLVLLFLWTSGLETAVGQTQADAVEAFNEAQELARSNQFEAAITRYERAIEISRNVGSEADQIRERAENNIPGIYFNMGRNALRNREFTNAIDLIKQAQEVAQEFGVDRVYQQTQQAMPVAHLQYGNAMFRERDFDAAEEQYRIALELNANYARPYYQLGLVYRQRGDMDQALQYFDTAISMTIQQDDTELERTATAAARDYLVFLAYNQAEDGRHRRAIELLNRSFDYDDSHAETYFRLAVSYNELSEFDEALRAATRGLNLEQGGRADRARYHFEIGTAQKNLGNESAACEHFRSAAVGPLRANAQHEIDNELNCD